MARNAMVPRVAVMAAVVAVAVAMSAGSADARRANAAGAEATGGVTLIQRFGGLRLPKIDYGKSGWTDFRLRAARVQEARIRLREPVGAARAARR